MFNVPDWLQHKQLNWSYVHCCLNYLLAFIYLRQSMRIFFELGLIRCEWANFYYWIVCWGNKGFLLVSPYDCHVYTATRQKSTSPLQSLLNLLEGFLPSSRVLFGLLSNHRTSFLGFLDLKFTSAVPVSCLFSTTKQSGKTLFFNNEDINECWGKAWWMVNVLLYSWQM